MSVKLMSLFQVECHAGLGVSPAAQCNHCNKYLLKKKNNPNPQGCDKRPGLVYELKLDMCLIKTQNVVYGDKEGH